MATSLSPSRLLAQTDFFESTPSGYLRVVSPASQPQEDAELSAMLAYMSGRGWASAQHIAVALNLPPGESGKRMVREIAARSGGAVISGQCGYKLTRDATQEERSHAVNWLRSQAREMMARADEIEART